MNLPRSWKQIEQLERHSLSKEYPDITGPTRERMLAMLKDRGIANDRKITLYESKVLDGWQLLQLCIEAKLKPSFQWLPAGWTAETYVEVVNDNRRHETQEQSEKRIVARRERVAAARRDAQSIRSIAEAEGVSPATVQRDLDAVTVPGGTVTPADGKVTGKDGRQQPATKPPKVIPQLEELFAAGMITEKLRPDAEALSRNQQGVLNEKVRAGVPVRNAISEALAPTREPGDEATVKRAPKNGRPVFDWRAFDNRHFGEVMRLPENLARAYPGERESPQFERLTKLLTEVAEVVKQWRTKLTKVKG